MYGVVLFHTTSMAMKAEKILCQAGLAVKMIPTPRQYSSDCGFALRFDWSEAERVASLLSTAQVDVGGLYRSDQST